MDWLTFIAQLLFAIVMLIGIGNALRLLVISPWQIWRGRHASPSATFINRMFHWKLLLCWVPLALLWTLIIRYFGMEMDSPVEVGLTLMFLTMPASFGIVAIFVSAFDRH